MNKIYLFSGLGADHRVFQFLDFKGFETFVIQWIKPQSNESIENYAKRLTDQIKADKPILIGLSFGGMIAIEVAKHIPTEKIILISSAKTKKEMPFYYRFAGTLKLHKLLPVELLKRANAFSYWLFGTKTKDEKQLLKSILQDTEPVFLKWAIDKIVSWTNAVEHDNLKHIHGTGDRILPIRYIKSDRKINNGGHFMIVSEADKIMGTINEFL
jgi:pimeloyl-ACP methyl ester carboxylesterase